MGFSYQNALFVSALKGSERNGKRWVKKTSPEIIKLVKQNDTFTPLGDEAYFPQCGTLTYAWAKCGRQPSVKTSGVPKGYKVFGLLDGFTGRFFHKAQGGLMTSENYPHILRSILNQASKHRGCMI